MRKILTFASVVEAGTALLLVLDPAVVAKVLLGTELSGVAPVLGRCFGIALAALALACWPSREAAGSASPALRGMLLYNALIALYLAYLGTAGGLGAPLLWPAVVLHAAVAAALIWTGRDSAKRP